MPTYNRAGIICGTLDNILQQTYRNIEIIVVDDGSTDDTQSTLKQYAGRIRVVTQINAGPAAARNHGIALCKGEIVCFQDSDDTWHPTKVEKQVSALLRAGDSVPCCLCNSQVQLHDGRVIRSFDCVKADPPIDAGVWLNVPEVLATRFILFNQAVAIRREVLERVGGFDESFRILEDVEMQLRLSLEGPWAVIREPLATRQDRFKLSLSNQESEETGHGYEVKAIERILAIKGKPRLEEVRPLLENVLRSARRKLTATRFKGSSSLSKRTAGYALEWGQRLRSALSRRMPWYPKMKLVPFAVGAAPELPLKAPECRSVSAFRVR